jgi:hypothetical protein
MIPEEPREFPIVNGEYDDEDESYLPLFDEGYFESDWNDEDGN